MEEHIFNFNEQMKMSQGVALSFDFQAVLLEHIPGTIDVVKATETEDKMGTDWWLNRLNNKPLSIDLKARSKDYGKDDVALETWSVVEEGKIGWTRDKSKATDYILWFWSDTRRWCLVPFPMLCYVFTEQWEDWCGIYKVARQKTITNGLIYHSECVFVPVKVVWDRIVKVFSGGSNHL